MDNHETRRHIRFIPDADDIGIIEIESSQQGKPKEKIIALIENQSYDGASLIFLSKNPKDERFYIGAKFNIQIGKLDPAISVIKRLEYIEDHLIKIGIEQFID